jgi:hypothetical protein
MLLWLWLVGMRPATKERSGLILGEDPDGIDPHGCADRDVKELKHGQHEDQVARPRLVSQQAYAAKHARKG